MSDLIEFLRARLDEDERVAKAATAPPWWYDPGKVWLDAEAFEEYDRSKGEEFVGYGESPFSGCIAATGPASHAQSMADAEHIARHDPARVLAEVDAKRSHISHWAYVDSLIPDSVGIVRNELLSVRRAYENVLLDDALPYADHPEYDAAWRP